MDSVKTSSDIEAAIQAGKDQAQLLPEVPSHLRAIIVPKGSELRSLTRDKMERPRFITAAPQFHESKAFIAYVNEFKDRATRIFYTQDGNFIAVIDYHDANEAMGDHGDHVAKLTLKRAPEWLDWVKANGEAMTQQDFAEFIEDHARDVTQPDPEQMLVIATGLQAKMGAEFRQAINQSDGTIQLQYDEKVEGTVRGSQQPIPKQFQVCQRPFRTGDKSRSFACSATCAETYRHQQGMAKHHQVKHEAREPAPQAWDRQG